ncbi:hypothetical protein, partial [Escherichia coli]|uniref:hypothetical protein n=1 Tax=Escherichia coli TaxID=562 RepID=UPI0015C9D53C
APDGLRVLVCGKIVQEAQRLCSSFRTSSDRWKSSLFLAIIPDVDGGAPDGLRVLVCGKIVQEAQRLCSSFRTSSDRWKS